MTRPTPADYLRLAAWMNGTCPECGLIRSWTGRNRCSCPDPSLAPQEARTGEATDARE